MTDFVSSFVERLRFALQSERWIQRAACRDEDTSKFFPERGQSKRPGLAICLRCEVKAECADYAKRSGSDYGIWGGVLLSRADTNRPSPPRIALAADTISTVAVGANQPAPRPPTATPLPIPPRENHVIPTSISASSAQVYEECPARWREENLNRAPTVSGEPAHLGTACHATQEAWVRDGYYKQGFDKKHEWSVMKALYDVAYWEVFADSGRYDEGAGLLKKWLERQDWEGRTVLTTELKRNFMLQTSAGPIPFNFIFDREDRLDNGDIEVVDYKTLRLPVSAEQLKHKLQARAYALAAQLLHPEAERIWVTFDMLRYEAVGVVFTKQENRGTWTYIHKMMERIIADDVGPEILGEGCRYCIRKNVCDTLGRHAKAGGPLGITDPILAARKQYELTAALKAIGLQITELDAVILADMREHDVIEKGVDEDYEVKVTVSKRRNVDPVLLAPILGADIMAKYGSITMGNFDVIMKEEELTDDQRSLAKQLVRNVYGDPGIKVTKISPFV